MTRYYMAPARPVGPRRRFNVAADGNRVNPPRQQQQQQQANRNQQAPPPPPLPPPVVPPVDPTANLGKPKSLLQLWHEYLHGMDDDKPAKDFTSVERGKVKFKHSRRKCFWDLMVRLMRAGHNELSATDLITQSYGSNKCCTDICKALQKAKKDGLHPTVAAAFTIRITANVQQV